MGDNEISWEKRNQRAKQFAKEISQVQGFYVENDIVFVRCETDEMTDQVLSIIFKY